MSTPVVHETGTKPLDTAWVREQFPSLNLKVNGHAAAFLDGPAGTQVPKQVMDAILTLVRAARPDSDHDSGVRGQIAWGPGPRASQALMLAARARALLDGRLAPSTDDVVAG